MGKNILFISKDRKLFQELMETIQKQGYSAAYQSYDDLTTTSIAWTKYHVCVIEHGSEFNTFGICNKALAQNSALKIVFITHDSPINVVEQRIIYAYPDNIISHSIPFIHTKILATINKLFAEDIFGFDFYMDTYDTIRSIPITDSKKKKTYIQEIINYALLKDTRTRILGVIVNVLDEMIMNAIYNAPTDDQGQFLYADIDRNQRVVLTDEQASTLSYVMDDYSIGISIRDPFGSLKKDTVLYYLYKCKRKGPDQIDAHKSGAGLGIYKTFINVNDFIINIATGVSTEFIVFISTGENFMKSETQSFNIFLQE